MAGEAGGGGIPGRRPDVDLNAFKKWSPEAQERALTLIGQRELNPWHPFYCPDPLCDGQPHGDWDFPHGRAEQRPPPRGPDADWLTWFLRGGRGGGKTRVGAEATHRIIKLVPRIHLIAPTGTDLRETMVEGESGLQVTAPPDAIPEWEPSKKKLTWPNGAVALGFSGEEPDRLRGPQCYWAWIDEPALMPLIDGDNGVWNNLLFGLRLGRKIGWKPWICATSTPKQNKWTKATVKDPLTRSSVLSTYSNLGNLAETFKQTVVARFEGTRLGQQELEGKVLPDVEGALWKGEWIKYIDVEDLPDMVRVIVAIDPAGSVNKKADETGIIVVGLGSDGIIYVIADYTDKYSPSGWADAAYKAYRDHKGDVIVAERNYGGDMVAEVFKKNLPKRERELIKFDTVWSRRGKAIRAEPIAALYEKGFNLGVVRVMHVRTRIEDTEDELTTWVPADLGPSPNRLDALVHGITYLGGTSQADVATADEVMRGPHNQVRQRSSAA